MAVTVATLAINGSCWQGTKIRSVTVVIACDLAENLGSVNEPLTDKEKKSFIFQHWHFVSPPESLLSSSNPFSGFSKLFQSWKRFQTRPRLASFLFLLRLFPNSVHFWLFPVSLFRNKTWAEFWTTHWRSYRPSFQISLRQYVSLSLKRNV